MAPSKFLVREGKAKVRVALAEQGQRPPLQSRPQPHPLQQTPQMTLGCSHLRRRLRLPEPRGLDPLKNRQTVVCQNV